LNWEIDSYPVWGDWSFDPNSGSNLQPSESDVIVNVEIKVPNEENYKFEGGVKIINKDNENDFCIIPVTITTPKCKENILFPFFNFFKQHPIMIHLMEIMFNI